MTLAEKLKQRLIFEIERIVSKCQIYYNQNTKSIWFINPETKFWYFEYSLDGNLWWRYIGFKIFKDLYRMDDKTFDDIISEWVEETLKCKVLTTQIAVFLLFEKVEETLKCKVLTTLPVAFCQSIKVEETLKCKVLTTLNTSFDNSVMVEETLKCKVITIEPYEPFYEVNTDKIINESQTI